MRASFAFVFLVAGVPLIAADGEWTRGGEAKIESKLVRHGIERAGASISPALWSTDGAWKLGAEAAVPFARIGRGELGASAGYTRGLDSGAKLGVEIAHFRFGEAPTGQPSQATELTASLSWLVGPGTASLRLTRETERRANIGELSYAGEYPLKSWGAFLNYRIYVGSVDADDVLPRAASLSVADAYTYHGVDLSLPYRIGGQAVLTAGVHYAGTNGARPFWSPRGAAAGAKVWFSLAASYEF